MTRPTSTELLIVAGATVIGAVLTVTFAAVIATVRVLEDLTDDGCTPITLGRTR